MPRDDQTISADALENLLRERQRTAQARRRIEERIATSVRPAHWTDPPNSLAQEGTIDHALARRYQDLVADWEGRPVAPAQERGSTEQHERPIPSHEYYNDSDQRISRRPLDTIQLDEFGNSIPMPDTGTIGRTIRRSTNSRLPQDPGLIQTVRAVISDQKCNLQLSALNGGFILSVTSPRNTNAVNLIRVRDGQRRASDPAGLVFSRLPIQARFAHGVQLVEREHEEYGMQVIIKEIKGE